MPPSATAPAPLRGVYALTPEHTQDDLLLAQVAAAVAGGVRWLQYRNKQASDEQRRRQATRLAAYCRNHAVQLIINDDVPLAQEVGAGGVHLGAQDLPVAAARAQLGEDAIIGCTCHDSLSLAAHAVQAGANYLAFGAVYPSPSKPQAVHCPLAVLRKAKQQFTLPLVAIGGITPDNAAEVVRSGADAIAVLHGLFAAADITACARALCRHFPPPDAAGA